MEEVDVSIEVVEGVDISDQLELRLVNVELEPGMKCFQFDSNYFGYLLFCATQRSLVDRVEYLRAD